MHCSASAGCASRFSSNSPLSVSTKAILLNLRMEIYLHSDRSIMLLCSSSRARSVGFGTTNFTRTQEPTLSWNQITLSERPPMSGVNECNRLFTATDF